MSPVTFGSVGDIIAVCQLAKSIYDALNSSRGSSIEYQGLSAVLRSVERALLEVELFIRAWRDASTPDSLQRECSKLVNECRTTLEAFQSYVNKYDTALSRGSRKATLKRARTKIKWQMLAKKDVARFRADLAGHWDSLHTMMLTASL